jgi:amino acid adenylation domain-containing protein
MTPLPYASLPEWFEHQVRQTPDAIALSFQGRTLTYDQLNRQSNQLARHLQKMGIGPEKMVGIYLDRSPDMLVALLGTLKAGGAYLPVDPTMPPDRQGMILKDAQAALMITQQSLVASLPKMGTPLFNFDTDRSALAAESADNPGVPISPHSLVYMIYTSGSTGVPKGVELEHRSLVNFLVSMKEVPGIVPDDVLLAVTTLSFDIAGLELWLPLVTGARIVLLTRDEASDGFRLLRYINDAKATILQAVPATWRMLLETPWAGSPKLKMLCGGEALPRELANQLLAKGGELWNMYGPTETTIWSTVARIYDDKAPISIGQPIAHTQLHILDANLQPVPAGVSGELHIGGLGLARGYHHRPELTAEKFIRDPFSTEPGARLYKTGDLARIRPQGQIEIQGRIDHQVKIRGFRIELGEIEARLGEHPLVKEAVVTAYEGASGRKQLVAYIVPRTGVTSPDNSQHVAHQIRLQLEKILPDYMVPSFFEIMSELPLMPNGKINRKALPKPSAHAVASEQPYVAPRNATEAQLAEIWQQVLGREKVGINDNIFEIGGDSLLIFQITARATQAGLPVTLPQVFQLRTIAELAAALSGGGAFVKPAASSAPAPLTRVSREAFRRPRAG